MHGKPGDESRIVAFEGSLLPGTNAQIKRKTGGHEVEEMVWLIFRLFKSFGVLLFSTGDCQDVEVTRRNIIYVLLF